MVSEDPNQRGGLNRRTMLRGVAGGALATTAFAGLVAGDSEVDSGEDCEWEYRCGSARCGTGYHGEQRYCCTNPDTGQRFCDDWQQMDICC